MVPGQHSTGQSGTNVGKQLGGESDSTGGASQTEPCMLAASGDIAISLRVPASQDTNLTS